MMIILIDYELLITLALCNLPLNNLNEKIFVLMWFWFCLVFILSLCQIIFRLVTIFPQVRRFLITSKKNLDEHNENLIYVLKKGSYGDWFVLFMLKKNINAFYFEEIIAGLTNVFLGRKRALEERRKKILAISKQFYINETFEASRENILNARKLNSIISNNPDPCSSNENNTGCSTIDTSESSSLSGSCAAISHPNDHYMETLNFKNGVCDSYELMERSPSYEEFDTAATSAATLPKKGKVQRDETTLRKARNWSRKTLPE
jgi:hypothetical protein